MTKKLFESHRKLYRSEGCIQILIKILVKCLSLIVWTPYLVLNLNIHAFLKLAILIYIFGSSIFTKLEPKSYSIWCHRLNHRYKGNRFTLWVSLKSNLLVICSHLMTGLNLMYASFMTSTINLWISLKSADSNEIHRFQLGNQQIQIWICRFHWNPQSSLRLEQGNIKWRKIICLERWLYILVMSYYAELVTTHEMRGAYQTTPKAQCNMPVARWAVESWAGPQIQSVAEAWDWRIHFTDIQATL